MRWHNLTFLLVSLLIASTAAEWSWGADPDKDKPAEPTEKSTELLEGETVSEAQEKTSDPGDDIVDELINRKQGRSLDDFDDSVYNDPSIKEALDAGDDAEARDLVKGRLCTLGLIAVNIHF